MSADDELPLPEPGDIIAQKYRVERLLGKGGMGVVFVAEHCDLEQRVALKMMLPTEDVDENAAARFAREAKIAAKLRSEHAARVIDFGSAPLSKGDAPLPYLVMEYLEGTDLGAVVKGQGPLEVEDVVEYLLHACEAVAEAHAGGIVHRDLKPANLFLTQRIDGSPCVKVLDFGISKLTNTNQRASSITATGVPLGTPYYMAPEQLESAKSANQRSDIWALGVVAYELLSGEVPFKADTITEICALVLLHEPAPFSSRRQDIPTQLEEAIMRCLCKKPDDRWSSVVELAAALSEFAPARAATYGERVAAVAGAPQARESSGALALDDTVARGERTITGAVWDHTRKRGSGKGSTLRVALVGAVAVGLAFAGMRMIPSSPSSDQEDANAEESTTTPGTVQPVPADATAAQGAPPFPSTSASPATTVVDTTAAPSAAVTTTSSAMPAAPPAVRRPGKANTQRSATPPTTQRPAYCSTNPTTLDATGNEIIRPECRQ